MLSPYDEPSRWHTCNWNCPTGCSSGGPRGYFEVRITSNAPPVEIFPADPKPHELGQWRPPVGEPGLEPQQRTDRRHIARRWREWVHARRHPRVDRAPPVLLAA